MQPPPNPPPVPPSAAASSSSSSSSPVVRRRGAPPQAPPPPLSALVPTLLRALRILKWAQAYQYYSAPPGAAAATSGGAAGGAARLRLALGQLGACTDWLLGACDADGRRGGVDWAALHSDEGRAKAEWLVVCILSVYSHAAGD